MPILLIALFAVSGPAAAQTIELDVLEAGAVVRAEGVGVFQSPAGGRYLGLSDGEYSLGPDTDLLIHFNTTGNASLVAGNYRVASSDLVVQDQLKALGTGGGLFTETARGLVLNPTGASLFQPGTHVGAFTLEFWFYSGAPREGGTILSWQGSSWTGRDPLFQQLSARIVNRKVVWELQNFFVRGDESADNPGFLGLPVQLSQRRDLVPRRWTHHMLRYDPDRNLLEYLVDGISEAITYVTDNRRESGTPYTPYVGELSEPAITIGRELNGVLDEMRLSRQWIGEVFRRGVSQNSGSAVFRRIDLVYPGAELIGLEARSLEPGRTEVNLFWFLSDLIESPEVWDVRWRPADESGSDASSPDRGRYLYLMAEFLPDGVDENRPGLHSISVDYRPDLAPPPPSGLSLRPVSGGIRVSWVPVVRGNPEGYKVYFGTRPGEYFGESATLGPSPLDAGSESYLDILGLDPGRVYYVRVASYNYSNNPVRGSHIPMQFSEEFAARPLR